MTVAAPDTTTVDRTEGMPLRRDPAGRSVRWIRLPPWLGAFVVTAALVAVTGHLEPAFLKPENLLNIARNQSAVGILAVGMTGVIVAGGIDLSVGSLVAVAGGVGVLVLNAVLGRIAPAEGDPTKFQDVVAVTAAAAATLGVGLIAGLVNGILIAKGRLPAFIVTLAALLALRSAAGWIANGGDFHPAHASPLFLAVGGGIPIPGTDTNHSRRPHDPVPLLVSYELIVWAVVALGGLVVLNRGRLGRYAVAVGSNARAARYSAVPVDRVRIAVYTLSGLLAGVAAFGEAARNEGVNSGSAGLNLELYAIAAAVIGGARMAGGVGSIVGAVIGALLLGVIDNVLVYRDVNSQAHGVVIGGIIVVAALAQRGRRAE